MIVSEFGTGFAVGDIGTPNECSGKLGTGGGLFPVIAEEDGFGNGNEENGCPCCWLCWY